MTVFSSFAATLDEGSHRIRSIDTHTPAKYNIAMMTIPSHFDWKDGRIFMDFPFQVLGKWIDNKNTYSPEN